MSDAISKTQDLGRISINIELLEPNPENPNEMSEREFNLLYDNIEKMGITDPILVRPIENGRYRIVGGHHRWEVAKLLGFEQVPCTVVNDPTFDEDQEKFQVVRMNVIRGHLSPQKFLSMYESLQSKYTDDVMQESFGFAEEEEFKKLISTVKKSLPKEMQKEFQKASEELKTIDDLSKLLNRLFTKYGDTLPYGYMLLDFGGKESIWLRMGNETRKAVLAVGKRCVEENRTVDDLIGGMIRLMAAGKLQDQLVQLIASSNPVQIPAGVEMPTAETLGVGGFHAPDAAEPVSV